MQAEALDSSKNRGINEENHNVPQITVEHFSFSGTPLCAKTKWGKSGRLVRERATRPKGLPVAQQWKTMEEKSL